MKILMHGKLPELVTYEGICSNCNCVYEFIEKEARKEFSCRNESFLITTCPTCYKEVYTTL